MAKFFRSRGRWQKARTSMEEDQELELHQIDPNGSNRQLLADITVPGAGNAGWLSDIRSYIEEMDLLEYSFDFWNLKRGCRIDKKFEKAIRVQGNEVTVVPVGASLPKRARLAVESDPIDVASVGTGIASGASVNIEVLDNNCSPSAFEPVELGDDQGYDNDTAPDFRTPSDSVSHPSSLVADSEVFAETDHVRMRSKLIFDDVRASWLKGVRKIEEKMQSVGLENQQWWLDVWDEGEVTRAKIWCNECKKWFGCGKVEEYSNTVSNFYRQHVMSSDKHREAYQARVGRDAAAVLKAAKEAAATAQDHRRRILEGVEHVRVANVRNGSECFIIKGDISNEKLSCGFFKWQCIYCLALHSLCPKTNNLPHTLEIHMAGRGHLEKKEAYEADRDRPKPAASGKVGRPAWKVQVQDVKQQKINLFFNSASTGSNIASGSGSKDKGTVDPSFVCWGLWQKEIRVNGQTTNIKPFLLDQLRGAVWYPEPHLSVEIEYQETIISIDGCFRHEDCLRISPSGFLNFSCSICQTIPQAKDFRNRILREQKAVEKRGTRSTGGGRRVDYLNTDEARMEHRKTKMKSRRVKREVWMLRARVLRHKAVRKSFIGVQTEFANRKDVTAFCRRIIHSWRDGLWGGRKALWDFMQDVTRNLPRKKEGHRFSKNSKLMWEVVKLRAGPAVTNFLTANLHGPSLSTVRRAQIKEFQYVVGEDEKQFKHIGDTYARLKSKHNINGPVPVIIAEDETSIRAMIRWVSTSDSLMGFCGTKKTASRDHKCIPGFSVKVGEGEAGYNAIIDSFTDCVKGRYARVLIANPLHDKLPALLIIAMATCNTFDAKDVQAQWQRVSSLWQKDCLDLVGPIIGHASDGDSRRRAVQMAHYYHRASSPAEEFRIEWEGFPLGATVDETGNVRGLDDQDWIHNVKKLISPMDSTVRCLWLGPFIVRIEHLQKLFNSLKFEDHGLGSADVYRKARQNFESAQILCSRKVLSALEKMRTDPTYGPPERTEGTEIYLQVVGDYVEIFASPTLDLRGRVVMASKVMWFLKLWRLFIEHGEHGVGKPSWKLNFISHQCFHDIVISCHFVVLLIKLFRDKYSSMPVPLHRTGSDVCEIFFSKVGGMAGVERAYDFGDLMRSAGSLNRLAEIESSEDGVFIPRAHRKMKTVWQRLHPVAVDPPDLGDYNCVSTDEKIVEALKDGFLAAQGLLRVLDMAPSVHCLRHKGLWYREPWKFEEPLKMVDVDLRVSVAEAGDDGDNEADEEEVLDPDGVPIDINNIDDDRLDEALRANLVVERGEAVREAGHCIHEMQDELEHGKELCAKYNPKVPLPGPGAEMIWKARLVSQLNGNPFLSKDRLQRVKANGNQYYSNDELARMRADPNLLTISIGHDVAVLFEREPNQQGSIARSVRSSSRGGQPAVLDRRTSGEAYVEIGRVQTIKRRRGKQFVMQKEIIDMDNAPTSEILLYLYWYTCLDDRQFSRFRYDGPDKCWVELGSVLQLVTLEERRRDKYFLLSKSDKKSLLEYVHMHNSKRLIEEGHAGAEGRVAKVVKKTKGKAKARC